MAADAQTGMSTSKMLNFFSLIGKLKHTKRTGWVLRAVPDPESIAGHMYRMAVMAMVLDKAQYDISRCVRLALVHDMAECIVGDITPSCGVSKEEKHEKEKAAMLQIKDLVGEAMGQEFYSLWEEYEYKTTPEAGIVKDLDRFDMVLQAFEYEKTGSKNLQEFFDTTMGKFQTTMVKRLGYGIV
uniref:5'-deoxynucleotidase HDDC2 n=1 Tax=Strigamia maritima TaxID=126957 RepID=T1JIX2_STRMM